MMLTRKQRWRRVQHQRPYVEPSAPPVVARVNTDGCTGSTRPQSPRRPQPIDALNIGDSLLQLIGSPGSLPTASCSPSPSPCPVEVEAPPTKSVCFHHQVRVILVPSRKELRALQLQLWWGADDYQHFRREYVMLLRMAAQKQRHDEAMQQQQQQHREQQLPRSSSPPVDSLSAAATAVSSPSGAKTAPAPDERSRMSPHRVPDVTPPPSCIVKVSEISPKAAAIDGRSNGWEQRGDATTDAPAHETTAAAPPVVLVATAIPPEDLSAAAAAVVPENSKEEEATDDCVKPTAVRPRVLVVGGSTKWTPSAGARAAAAAAAEAEFEDYRTSSMSSVSEGYFADDRDSDDGDDEICDRKDHNGGEGDDDARVCEEAPGGASATLCF